MTNPQNPPVPPPNTPEAIPPPDTKRRNHMLWILTIVLAVLALAWLLLYLFYFQYHATTDDAYANGNLININSAITGSVTAFYADNTDYVIEGQLLVQLDCTYYQTTYEKALAALAAQAMQIQQYADDVRVNEANVKIKKTSLSRAQFDYDNRAKLVDVKAVSNEDFIHSRDSLTIAENELKIAENQLKASQARLGNTPLDMHPLLEERKSSVREAYYNIKHCNIYAPATGYIAQRSVNVGQSVTRTTPLMAVVPIDYVWVDANFKETELTYMRVGQPAKVWLDIYGSKAEYQGKVLGIASGTGSVFSLIPPQNATGNWIKIVQRLPVRISLDPETLKKYPARLGLSADVNVDLSNQDLPMLTQVPSTKPVAVTNVFDIHLEEVNQIINQILGTYFPL